MSIPFLTTSTPALLGWIPFFLCLVGSLISSWLYIMWHRSIRDGEGMSEYILLEILKNSQKKEDKTSVFIFFFLF